MSVLRHTWSRGTPNLGVIQSTPENPTYHFGTAAPERMSVVSGALVRGEGGSATSKKQKSYPSCHHSLLCVKT